MRTVWLASSAALAALAIPAAPAPAQVQVQGLAGHGVTIHRGGREVGALVRFHRGDRRHRDGRDRDDRRRRDRFDDALVIGSWGYYDERPSDRAWEPDSYNDWWHDRPDRSYPRWVQNGRCDRQWWSGGGWRC